MESVTTLHPAKRIWAVYFLSFLIIIAMVHFGLGILQGQQSLGKDAVAIIWKTTNILGLVALAYLYLWDLTSVFTISGECVTATMGILSKSHIRIPMNRITDYQVITPFHERILGIGSIHIDTAGDDLIMRQISRTEIDSAVLRLEQLLNKEQYRSDSDLSFSD